MLDVTSEIGRLRRVLVHAPGPEVDRMVPAMMEQLLFDDILDGDRAREEHGQLRRVMQLLGVEVIEAGDLLQQALECYKTKAITGDSAVEEDFLFHLKIAEVSKNGVIKSLMMIIAPEIMQIYRELMVCNAEKANVAYDEHIDLFNSIVEGDSGKAAQLMTQHLQGILEFSKTQKK